MFWNLQLLTTCSKLQNLLTLHFGKHIFILTSIFRKFSGVLSLIMLVLVQETMDFLTFQYITAYSHFIAKLGFSQLMDDVVLNEFKDDLRHYRVIKNSHIKKILSPCKTLKYVQNSMIKNIISVVAAHSILLSILQKGTFIYFLTLRKIYYISWFPWPLSKIRSASVCYFLLTLLNN